MRRFRSSSLLLALCLALPAAAGAQDLPWQLTTIPAPNPAFGLFGSSVAISGNTLVISGLAKTKLSGIVYVYVRNQAGWTQQAAFTVPNPHQFNVPPVVAVSGDTLVAGIPNLDVRAPSAGAAFVYTRQNGAWTRQARLVASDGGEQEFFGTAVTISGDTIAVGAPLARGVGGDAERRPGAVYVFRRSGRAWKQEVRISPAGLDEGAQFGHSVSLSGNRLAVGAILDGTDPQFDPGSAWVFVRRGVNWHREARLHGSTAPGAGHFGETVSLSGDTLAVGAFPDRAYIFQRGAGGWRQQAQLTRGDDPLGVFFFGFSVVVSGDLAVVLGNRNTPAGEASAFGAYLFQRESDGTWTRLGILDDTLLPFGPGLAIDGETIVIGSARTGDSGEVRVYTP